MSDHRSGPVRSAAAREAILDATAALFDRVGYDHLTIEGIAREAGVGKQTIYRWWPSRGALVAECLVGRRLFPDFDVPDTGDLLADLDTWLDTVLGVIEAPSGGDLLRSLVAAAAEDPAVGGHLSEGLGIERSLAARLAAGVRAGQLPVDTPAPQLGEAILGAVIVQSLGRSDDHAALRRLVRFLLRSPTADA